MKVSFHPFNHYDFLNIVFGMACVGVIIGGNCIPFFFETNATLWERILVLVLSPFLLYVFAQGSIGPLMNTVVFEGDTIHVRGEWLTKDVKDQYPDVIPLNRIVDVRIIYSTLNSQKRSHKGAIPLSHSPRTFYEFILDNGKTKWLYISTFSRKQREKMLDIVNEHNGLHLTYRDLVEEDQTPYRRKKKTEKKMKKK